MKRRTFILTTLSIPLIVACSKDEPKKSSSGGTTTPEETDEPDIFGFVRDNNGNGLQGVVVSDGYSVTVTDANGEYKLTSCEYSYQVYVTIPAEYEVPMKNGLPYFWQDLVDGQDQYDFELTPLAGGVETQFNLFCIADPQCKTETHVGRFRDETCPDVKKEVAASTIPSYGVVLGDIGWNTASKNYCTNIFPLMKTAMAETNTGLPLFMCIGNHDHTLLINNSSYSVAKDIEAQREYENYFGPANYSFDRGNAHIIVMDNTYYTTQGNYELGFRSDQLEWLRQDLNRMGIGKLLIFCTHIPMRQNVDPAIYVNAAGVFNLIAGYVSNYHIMSGHVHCQEYTITDKYYEHNHGSACGAWWNGTVCADGAPNGYAVYRINGSSITNWYYKGTDCDDDFQIRMYHANDTFTGGYTFQHYGANAIIANIWNGTTDWKVQVYEDGVYTGDMSGGDYEDRDAWASGYYMGYIGKKEGSDYDKTKMHFWYYTLKNSNPTTVEIVATDTFGNVYRQSKFTGNGEEDYPVSPVANDDTDD